LYGGSQKIYLHDFDLGLGPDLGRYLTQKASSLACVLAGHKKRIFLCSQEETTIFVLGPVTPVPGLFNLSLAPFHQWNAV